MHYWWRYDYYKDNYRIWKVCAQGDLERLLALSGMSYEWLSHCGVHTSSTVWIPVKFDISGKLFSRRIQLCMLRKMRIPSYGKHRQLPKLCHSDHSRDIGGYQIRTSPFWTSPLLPRLFSFSLAPIWVRSGSFWTRNITFISRIVRVWVLLLWNGPVGLSYYL